MKRWSVGSAIYHAGMDVLPFLAQVRARLRRVLVIEGLARLLATALLLAGAAVLADFAWPSPGWLRLMVLLAIVVGLVVIARRRLWLPLGQAFDDLSLARFAERRLPHLDGRLLSAVEGLALGGEQVNLAGELARHPAATLVPAPRLPRWLVGAVALMSVVVATAFFAPRFFNDGATRLLAPLSAREWARATTLNGTLTPAVVAADQKLTLAITRHHDGDGDFSAPVVVSWAHADLPGQSDVPVESRQLPGLHGSEWTASLPALPPGTWAITVTSADAVPLHLLGRSVARPALGRITAKLTPPGYVQAPAQDLPTLACTALPGSRLDFQIAISAADARAISSAGVDAVWSPAPPALEKLAAPPGGRLPATGAAASPGVITGSIIITRAGTLSVNATDADGISLDPPPKFAVTLLEDRAPTVSLDGPGHDEAVSTHGVIEVKVEGGDDHGLALLELLGSVTDLSDGQAPASAAAPAPAPETRIADFPGARGATATTWPEHVVVADHAALNQRLTLVGHARDANDVSGPGDTRSDAVSLRVVSDEELRQELERLLATARERVTQAREELAAAAEKPEAQPAAARSSGLVADKATALLVQVLRRWKQNALPAEQIVPAGQAKDLIVDTASPALNEAAGTVAKDALSANSATAVASATAAAAANTPPRERADAALAEAERLLGTLLQDGDLTRKLTALIGQETTLADETRKFTLEYLDKPLDDAGTTRKANLSQRQADLAKAEGDIERQVLSGNAANLNAAKAVVRANPAQEPLNQAAAGLASDAYAGAPTQQAAGIDAMKKLLEALRGGDAQGKLADRVGELAAEEEQILKALDSGTPPANLAEQQRDVKEKTERLEPEVAKQDPDAGKAMTAAAAAATAAGSAMSKGDGAGSGQSAGAAASLLRTAQSKLDPKSGDQDKDADQKNPKKASLTALLRALLNLQATLVSDCTVLDARLGEQDPDFSAQRDLQGYAQTQSDILLRLHQEGEEPLKDPQDPHPVALAALARVATAMDAAHDHLAKPALGAKGMRLERIALSELQRLVDIVGGKGQPPPKSGGGGKGNGSGNEAPFPPAAEIAWLAANQEDIAAETAAGRPVDIAAEEAALRDLATTVASALRPDTRPGILMERVRRATASAAWRLGKQDRGATTRDEQDAAVAALHRILAEIEAGNGGGKGSGDGQTAQNRAKSQQSRSNQSQPAPGDQNGDPKGSAAPSGGANGEVNKANTSNSGQVETAQNGNSGLNLPEEKRKQLAEVLRENLSPSEKQLYRAYIEELDAKP